jgi:LysM repeat protein
MTPITHIVKAGDTLWDLSQQYLQDPKRWPEIWDYNNDAFVRLPAANKMRPSVAIKNPHLIFVGQKLLVPTKMMKNNNQLSTKSSNSKSQAATSIRSIPVKYSVNSREYKQILPMGMTATVKISAEVTLQSDNAYTFAELSNNELNIKASIKRKNQDTLEKLLSGFTLGLNTKTKQISFESQITVNSGESYEHTWSTKVTLNPITGQPIYTVSIKFPEIKGKLERQLYLASQYQVDIEITNEGSVQGQGPTAVPSPVAIAAKYQSNDWAYAIGTVLIVGAVVIIVATIAEDIITLGVGIADDAVSFALAAGMLGRAWTMIRVQQLGVQLGTTSAIGASAGAVAF